MATQKDIEKVKKLRRLATSPEPHEAARAQEEATRLMIKFGLTENDFTEDVTEVVDDKCDANRRELARVIALSRRCQSLVSKKGNIGFRGHPSAVISATRLYHSLVNIVSESCNTNPNAQANAPGRLVWKRYYWRGFVDAVSTRLLDEEVRSWIGPQPKTAKIIIENDNNEADLELRTFASFFAPQDVVRGVNGLCTEACEAGKILGKQVTIESFKAEVKGVII